MSDIHTNRPLSPHVGIYRWQITNTLSILHRITGFGLVLGLIPLTAWLWGAAANPPLYTMVVNLATTLVGKILLTGWMAAFYYHLINGIRHLNWDIGHGFSLPSVTRSGRLTILLTIALTVYSWYVILGKLGGIA